jgi:anti-sigma factor RsiW
MTCEQFRERLTAFSLGELESHEAVAAREHVSHCSACASSALLDRQLTALVRSSAVSTPPEARARILAELRTQAAAEPGRRGRRRHWLSLGAAAGLAAALLAATVLVVPVPQRSSPLEAAWSAYRSEPLMLRWDASTQKRLTAVLGPAAATPNLAADGFRVQATGSRMLAGHLAAVTEYRDPHGRRVTLIRWKGSLPEMAGANQAADGAQVEGARWNHVGSMWWQGNGIVYCLIGGVDQATLYKVTDRLRSLEDW